MMIRAVVFDFDGLILDTETSIWTVVCDAFDEHGCARPTIEEWATEIGTVGGLDVIAMLQARAEVDLDIDAVRAQMRARRDELLEREATRPGVEQWIEDAHARGFGVAIASSSPRDWVEPHLVRLGLRAHFTHLACHHAGLAAKPAPDTYLDACAALTVEPREAIAVEDSPHGVRAARAAGLRVVAVPNTVTAQMDLGEADLVVDSLADWSLARVLNALAD
jgi:HAD superfamily hydrolase (TIGR01509 family)